MEVNRVRTYFSSLHGVVEEGRRGGGEKRRSGKGGREMCGR